MSVSRFFQVATKIGLSGEEVHFILVSLDFDIDSALEGVQEVRRAGGEHQHSNVRNNRGE